MSHTIKGFQDDKAVILSEIIQVKTGEQVDPGRISGILRDRGVVSDYTYWQKLPRVLAILGFDYDEIEEVAL